MAKPLRKSTASRVQLKRAPTSQTKSAARVAKQTTPGTKLDAIINALRSPKGASITQLMTITGWQMHSVRGALAGALKKERGLQIISSKEKGERIYRIEAKK